MMDNNCLGTNFYRLINESSKEAKVTPQKNFCCVFATPSTLKAVWSVILDFLDV